MLNIYYGRENINKDKFIFDNVKGKTLLLVPDQFTLEAERSAFFYLQTKGLMDLEVVSISRLGLKVLTETGGGKKPLINKYGRHMLLAEILNAKSDELVLYKNQGSRTSFIEMTNNFISEMKQYSTSPEDLKEIIEKTENNTFLKLKLADIYEIYSSYEKEIQGKYIDTEDYVDIFAGKIPQSRKLRETEIWAYGFDYFTPKNMQVIEALMITCPNVNVVMTGSDFEDSGVRSDTKNDRELFEITESMIKRLENSAIETGIDHRKTPIGDGYAIPSSQKAPALLSLERELYSFPGNVSDNDEGITLVRAANLYSEAETAAAEVLRLVRDEGAKYKDIMIICNDLETRGSIAKRTFSQYGIELFVDKKRSLLHSPSISYMLALMDIVTLRYRTQDVFRLLKTGLSFFEWEDIEALENYATKYKINGGLWQQPFVRGSAEYEEAELASLEESRSRVCALVERFKSGFADAGTAYEKVRAVYDFLQDEARLPEKLEALMVGQRQRGFFDIAEETAQAWNVIVDVLDQLQQLLGKRTIDDMMLRQILKAGFEAVEIGLLPPTADGLVMGTMQRTRCSGIKYLLVMGANDGLLPASAKNESILSTEEKKRLFADDIEICKLDELRLQEEKLAIYKNLTKPSEGLWMSCSVSDIDGAEQRPSVIFEKLQKIYPDLEVEEDIVSRDDALELIQSSGSTLRHLARRLQAQISGQETEGLPHEWRETALWYSESAKEKFDTLKAGLTFTNSQKNLDERTMRALFSRSDNGDLSDLIVSPSALEKYSKCPFSYFVDRGMRPEELRVFEIGSRDIGDIYHSSLMEFSKELTPSEMSATDENSPWMTIEKEQCSEMISEIVKREIGDYREGLFESGRAEEYRTSRLEKICAETAWALVENVREQKTDSMVFEESFGRDMRFPPVKIDLNEYPAKADETGRSSVKEVLLEGKIDRADFLQDESVKITDYKTGNEKFSKEEILSGWKLQLMIYLKAVQTKDRTPSGLHYFLIKEPYIDMSEKDRDSIKASAGEAVTKNFKLSGVDIASTEESKKGDMSAEEFEEFRQQTDAVLRKLCTDLASGDISVRPKKNKQQSACDYCLYRGICMYDKRW